MNLALLLVLSAIILILAYKFYGSYVYKKFGLSDENKAPSHTLRDGVDYEPSKPIVVLGHHFASIAGAGPIVGPIIAVTFGWVPAVLWILIGGIFFGAVHDLGSMAASLRTEGKSIGVIIRKQIGLQGKQLFVIFSFSTLILVIGVFADIIAKTFVSNPGVASASIFFIFLAIAFGMVNRAVGDKKITFVIISVVGVILMYFFVYLGMQVPFVLDYKIWILALLAYAFIASVTPVSLLLQPRDYLNSFLLYGMMIAAILGVFIANPEIKMSSEVTVSTENLGYIFPVLFVTIACGAISGFHSLVASGTTSKQLDKESDAKVVGFGGMLIESFLAIISVGAVVVLTKTEYLERLAGEGPVSLFSTGLGGMIASLGISESFAVGFVALTVSAFALTTLDTCTRLARFTLQEYFEDLPQPSAKYISNNRFISTGLVVVFSVLLLLSGEFTTLWPIFGSANQLLAALALLTIAVWMIRKKKNALFVTLPMFFMFTVTLASLGLFAWKNFQEEVYVLSIIAALLFVLAISLLVLATKSIKKEIKEPSKAL
ncbi:MAG TPA: carbon starvation protein A [Algoriphagus sp.]|jgi:carbon starvation protein|uniref:carbon starvation CstA family protein n=1 Tax=unclassified Algoriphagus TaxID=2641541 RepID=UPI000C6B063D|nr:MULTISPECIES: carbon starvation protein A [unclassified Algoriphagus]MAL12376.1 carbon starvation protein A [Algoriphagus sp.]QYH40228.1 carbon starvation protein A [Algoriphagus sp. NBT04N3]HAH38638.1 carbon starvation protein A [Algoriphagus sp.]HAS59301.1 carbon starvation protein A [Algoriphagus sp.]HAZ26396.1 carbon starvation protein A [Algoriphagus sp.]